MLIDNVDIAHKLTAKLRLLFRLAKSFSANLALWLVFLCDNHLFSYF